MTLNRYHRYPGLLALMLMALTLLFPGAAMSDSIYRQVDEDGNVTYTDEPPDDESKPLELDPLPQMNIPSSDRSSRPSDDEQDESGNAEPEGSYKSLAIREPEHDSAFWRGGGEVTVRIHSEPKLSEGHQYQLEFDGEAIEETRNTSITLENVDRGTHELTVHILDSSGEVIQSSDRTRFTLHRPSQLN